MTPSDGREIALVLAGGNALGAYAAGACEALLGHGIVPDRISGASVGAIVGAIIAGNAPDVRIAKLREFWEQATLWSVPLPPSSAASRRASS